MNIKCNKGQALVEYLVLIGVIAVASISIVTVLSANIQEHYARISNSITGRGENVEFTKVNKDDYSRRGMSDYNAQSLRK